jgi:hypothetical protein
MLDSEDVSSKKSLNSIQGYECTIMLESIIASLKISNGLQIFKEVTKMLKYFTKQKSIYGANICFFNGMTLQVMTLYVMEQMR